MDRIWGIRGSYYNMPEAIFYLLKGDYSYRGSARRNNQDHESQTLQCGESNGKKMENEMETGIIRVTI